MSTSDKVALIVALSKIPMHIGLMIILGMMIYTDYTTEHTTGVLIEQLMTRQVIAFEKMEANGRKHNTLVEGLLEEMGC